MLSENNASMSPAEVALLNRNNGCNGMFGDGNGAWFWIVILFLFAFCGGNWGGGAFGGGNSGAADNYVLTSDFSQLSRQISDATAMTERKMDSITNGLCDGFYTTAQLVNGTNMNMANGFAAAELSRANQQAALMQTLTNMQMQNQQCCCDQRAAIADVKYAMALGDNATQNAINTGFCQTNYNNQSNTRDLIENQNANARAILDALNRQAIEAKDAKIADQNQQIFALQLAASQARQNELLIDRLGYHCPQPAYVVQPPQQVTFPTNCCGGVNYASAGGCGCNG